MTTEKDQFLPESLKIQETELRAVSLGPGQSPVGL